MTFVIVQSFRTTRDDLLMSLLILLGVYGGHSLSRLIWPFVSPVLTAVIGHLQRSAHANISCDYF